MQEFSNITIDDVDAGNRALDAWRDAEGRALQKVQGRK